MRYIYCSVKNFLSSTVMGVIGSDYVGILVEFKVNKYIDNLIIKFSIKIKEVRLV